MKFLCDRCSTRYSIGDDRVRGKILKIRCKSCGNVITVREGMPSPDDADPPAAEAADPAGSQRAPKSTTAAPAAQSEALASGGALGAAFASAMTKPPPALEPEWYVSLEGAQSGPFSLADAQRWISRQPPAAELFCWSEGFDDWLPVDEVNHFRGLRKPAAPPPPPPAAAGPPPLPRRAATPRPEPVADGPRPRFAATMAQLEKGGGPAAPRPLDPTGLRPAPRAEAAAPRPLDPRGARPLATPSRATPTNGLPPAGAPLANGAAAQARGDLPSARGARGATPPGAVARSPVLGGRPPADAFDASELADSATQLDAPTVDPLEAAATAPRLPALDRANHANRANRAAAAPASALVFPEPAPASPGDSGDDLDIAEVSRVVKLADLAREANLEPWVAPAPQVVPAPQAPLAGNRTGTIARLEGNRTGPIARLEGGVPLAAGGLAGGAGAAALLPGAEPSLPSAHVSHRRAMIALISGAVVLVGVAVAVVFFVLTSHEEPRSRLGQVEEIDTTRPEEPRPTGSGSGSAAATSDTPATPATPKVPRRVIMQPTGPATPEGPDTGGKLEAREIEEMAGKNSSVTQRCYMRAQRGAEGILLADVKKISVTLTINGEGQVTDAQLSDNHAQDSLGKCLIATIKTWRFRASPGGTFRFVLHFG